MICTNPNCGREYREYMTDEHGLCKMCDMLFSASPPSIHTEATFQAKAAGKLGGAQFHPALRRHYLDAAREAGVTTEGRYYEPRLAAYPGDPRAWVSNPDEIKSVVEERGWSMTGDSNVKAPEIEPPKRPAIAPDLVEELVESKLEEKLGDDFVEAKGGVVERAVEDVMNQYAPPAHLAN